MQGADSGLCIDSLVNDFVAGEIEHAVWSTWEGSRPEVIVIEGQGSLLHPAYPGGLEIIAAARPQAIVVQHAPARRTYDGFEAFPLHPLERQIQAIEIVSGVPVVAVTINATGLTPAAAAQAAKTIRRVHGRPAVDPVRDDIGPVVQAVAEHLGRAST